MSRKKCIYFLISLVSCNLFAWSVPFKDTIPANPEVQSVSLGWSSVFYLSCFLVIFFGLKAGKKFREEDYTAGLIRSVGMIIAGLTSLLAKVFI